MLNNSNPSNPHSISVMINCPLKLILASICQASKPASQQRKVLLFSIWIRVLKRPRYCCPLGLLTFLHSCLHCLSTYHHLLSDTNTQSSPVPSVASSELFQYQPLHCLIDRTVYERWFIVYVHWLRTAGLQQPAIHSTAPVWHNYKHEVINVIWIK